MTLFLTALLGVSLLSAETTKGVVRFHNQPVPGALVETPTHKTTTDESGQWSLDLPPGTHTVRFSMFGFQQKTVDISTTSNHLVEVALELLPKPPSHPAGAAGFTEFIIQDASGDLPPDPPPPSTDSASESFLLSGSLTHALAPTPAAPLESTLDTSPVAAAQSRGDADGVTKKGRIRTKPVKGDRPAKAARAGNKRKKKALDAYRGSATWSFRDSALDARPFSITGQTIPKPDYAQHRFGASFGGPITTASTFFISYNGARSSAPFHAVATLADAAERAGDFAASSTRLPVTVYDPTTRQPFPSNRIPVSRIAPAAQGLLPFIPLPNQPGKIQNYQYATAADQNRNDLNVRVNQTLAPKVRIGANLQWQNRSGTQALPFTFFDTTSNSGINLDASLTQTLNRRTVNTLRFLYNRGYNELLPFFAYGRNVASELGIRGTSPDHVNYGPPNLNFTNFGALSDGSPNVRRDLTTGLTEGITHVHGKHNLSIGGDFRLLHHNVRTDQNARGTFTFSGLRTSGFDAQGNPLAGTGFDFADFLLGLPQSGSVRYGSSDNQFRAHSYSAYTQDDWRMRPNFSVTLGFRYEYLHPFRELRGQIANLDIAPGFTGVAVVTPGQPGPYSGTFSSTLLDPDRNNFSPRVGLAWKPSPRKPLTIRGGYGVYYNSRVYTNFATRLASQPPFARTSTVNTSNARPLTLEDGFTTAPTQTIRNTFAVDRHYRIGYAQNWNFSVQRDLPRSFVIEGAYLGVKGTRLDVQRQPNRAAPGSQLDAETRRLIGNAVGFTFDSAEGNSIYHAGQARLTRRFRRGTSMSALYTYGKSIDNVSTFGGGGTVVAQDDRNLSNERGLSTFDRRHSLALNYFVMSPFAQRRFTKDWTLSGTMAYQSGNPFTARVLGNRSDSNGTGVIGSGRADATSLGVRDGDGYFNLAAFTVPPPGRYGNAGRNTIPGPQSLVFGLALARNFRFTDRKRMDIRIESQNVTNHTNISGINGVVNSLNYGLATAAAPMRSVSGQVRFRF
ncbi:MAG: TonB-dependent receptor [Acidobacteria bacterium]|nr:TonB-dependent receptor [Acidobacteriota bacterium]